MNSLIVMCVFTVLFCSCNKETSKSEAKGNVKFSISSATNLKSAVVSDSSRNNDTTAINYFAMITLIDQTGNVIYNSKLISLYTFGGQYLSENVTLPTGTYKLTQFIILKGSVAIYATPVAGSERAQLVQTPLPLNVVVTENNTTQVAPQVLAIDNSSPESFGYTNFSFSVVNTLVFKMIVYGPDSLQHDTIPISANLQVSLYSRITQNFRSLPLYYVINPSVTNIEVNNSAYYFLAIYKKGYSPWEQNFSYSEIESFISTPLIVHLNKQSDTISLRPLKIRK